MTKYEEFKLYLESLKTNNIKHQVALKTTAGEYKKICIKELYKLVYNKNTMIL